MSGGENPHNAAYALGNFRVLAYNEYLETAQWSIFISTFSHGDAYLMIKKVTY